MPSLRSLIAVGAFLLTGCSSVASTKYTSFTAGSSPTGLIVVGASITRYDSKIDIKDRDALSTVSLDWVRWTGTFTPLMGLSLRDRSRFTMKSCNAYLSSERPEENACNLTTKHYYVLEVEPGDFQLVRISRTGGFAPTATFSSGASQPGNTPFITHGEAERSNISSAQDSDGKQFVAHVGPGEIIYVGDLLIDPTARPISIAKYDVDEVGARKFLADFPNLHGEPTYRRMTSRPQLVAGGAQP